MLIRDFHKELIEKGNAVAAEYGIDTTQERNRRAVANLVIAIAERCDNVSRDLYREDFLRAADAYIEKRNQSSETLQAVYILKL